MATPTPTSTPTTAGKRPAGGGVSTPSHHHLNSPAGAPRSVPSPATTRHPASKTPASTTSSRTLGGTGTGGGGGTPMMRGPSQTASNPSPSTATLGGGGGASLNTPTALLGLDTATTPSILNLGTPSFLNAATSAAMIPSMSELGLALSTASTTTTKHNEEAVRRARQRRILSRIGQRVGRVSEEGIARIAGRVGFAHDLVPVEKLAPDERERKVGNRPISIAGNTVIIEVDLRAQVPRNVSVSVNGGGEEMREEERRAGEVLMKGLRVPSGTGGGVLGQGLKGFATDLEALARVDRLSGEGVSCFEALGGVYASLRRLFEEEVRVERAGGKALSRRKAERRVMSRKSGMPLLHARGRIATEIIYWQSAPPGDQKSSGQEMEVDGEEKSEPLATAAADEDSTFSLKLETEACPASLYPSLRVSNSWLPETITLPATSESTTTTSEIPWQDPPPTVLPSEGNNTTTTDAMTVNQTPKLPDLRFIARLDPPLVLPYQTAIQVLASVGLPAPPMMTLPPQYAASVLQSPTSAPHVQQHSGPFSQSATQTVLSVDRKDGSERLVSHVYALDTAKPDWAFTLRELPFSHPRQLVEVLPVLRQWAVVGMVLRRALLVSRKDEEGAEESASNVSNAAVATTMTTATKHETLSLHHLTNPTSNPNEPLQKQLDDEQIPVNILLTTSPIPTFGFTFPKSSTPVDSNGETSSLITITLQVLPNAHISVVGCNGLATSSLSRSNGKGKNGGELEGKDDDMLEEGKNGDGVVAEERVRKRVGRTLEVCGDVGVWVEWMRGTMRFLR